jgi:hypothetical protein
MQRQWKQTEKNQVHAVCCVYVSACSTSEQGTKQKVGTACGQQ